MSFQPTNEFEAQLAAVVDGLDYGPDWTFTLARRTPGSIDLEIVWSVADVADSSKRTLLLAAVHCADFAYYRDEWLHPFLHTLEARIADLEGHERLERLTWHGERIWNPHPVPGGNLLCRPQGHVLERLRAAAAA